MRDDQDARIEAFMQGADPQGKRLDHSCRSWIADGLAAADAVHEREPGAAGPSREDSAATDLHWAAMAEAEVDQFRLRAEAAEAREEALRDERSGLIEDLMRAEEDRDEWARESKVLRKALQDWEAREVWEVERDRHGVMFSGPLKVGECVRVVRADAVTQGEDRLIEALRIWAQGKRSTWRTSEAQAHNDCLSALDDFLDDLAEARSSTAPQEERGQ